jgi:hypothetical protein
LVTRAVRVLAVAAGLGAVLVGCSTSASAAKDVSISACTASPSGGHPVASGAIHNQSSKASSYTISVTFKDASGNRVSQGGAVVAKVSAGGTATWHVTGVTSAKGPVACSLGGVTRTLAP